MRRISNDTEKNMAELVQNKVTIIFDDTQNELKIHNFPEVEWDLAFLDDQMHYFDLSTGSNIMIPFLTVKENLLLGIPRKEVKEILAEILDQLSMFHLNEHLLEETAIEISDTQQVLLQIIRAIILDKVIIFDRIKKDKEEATFVNNLLPALFKLKFDHHASIIILTDDKELLDSIYYDQVFILAHK
ncbi:P-loop NTPase family protein [Vagococcus silagei]|uniref:ATP-binding cassette domain-containing protein n=1 Tax=Vagococcus silagei TaxID=2508885 RepID=A0A4S3B5B4_9ENTE|nr:hypothetical protein [Vagococcus silagei]THB61698.1 hypothetical protein ESZ54_04395 [Vagococcus silagei]